jgi:hypothetical protein
VPEFLWNTECRYEVDSDMAAPFVAIAKGTNNAGVRDCVTGYMGKQKRPVVCFIRTDDRPPQPALVSGYTDGGETILVRYAYMPESPENEPGSIPITDWEQDVLAVIGISDGTPEESKLHPSYVAITNGLKYSRSHTVGTKHYGLNAYDAWANALLNDAWFYGVSDEIVARRLAYHSILAGSIACQKAFTAFPEGWRSVPGQLIPGMGVINETIDCAQAHAHKVHGHMWDVWHVVGGYRKGVNITESGISIDDPEEITRFRDRGVRERAVEVIQRARQTDETAIAEMAEAKMEWDKCRGRGGPFHCPCMNKGCTRV